MKKVESKSSSNYRVANPEGYREIRMDCGGIDRFYKNPMTRIYQYEYALYEAVRELFAMVRCRSMCIERLRLYFRELAHASSGETSADASRKQEDITDEVRMLVARDVVGHVTFPMMHICGADAHVIEEEDGTHTFVCTDGIYGFSVHLDMPRKGHPRGILVRDLSPAREKEGVPCPLEDPEGTECPFEEPDGR